MTMQIILIFALAGQLATFLVSPKCAPQGAMGCCGQLASDERYDLDWAGDPEDNLVTVYGFDADGTLEIHVNAGQENHAKMKSGNYVTRDSGASWRYLQTPSIFAAHKTGAAHSGKRVVYHWINSPSGGVYEKSIDGGKTWTPLAARLAGSDMQLHILTVVSDPADPNMLYSQGCVERNCSIRSPSFGVYLSRDGGQNFSLFSKDLTEWSSAFAINPQNNKVIYAVDLRGNLIKTEDRGRNWEPVGQNDKLKKGYTVIQGGKRYPIDKNHFAQILLDPKHPDTIYVISDKGLLKSTDGGAEWCVISWKNSDGYTVTPVSLAVDTSDNTVLFAGTFYGLFKSTDQGCTWKRIDVVGRLIR